MPTLALIHPQRDPEGTALGMHAVILTAQRQNWDAQLFTQAQAPPAKPNIVAFSIYSPLQFPNIPAWLRKNGLDPRSSKRQPKDPLVIAGGPACASPGPILPFVDAFVMGDAETTLPPLLTAAATVHEKSNLLHTVAQLQGTYVPGYSTRPARWLTTPRKRVITHGRHVLAARGCRYNCPFCQVVTIHAPYRPTPAAKIIAAIERIEGRPTLSAPAITHHPQVHQILGHVAKHGRHINSVNACLLDLRGDERLIPALAAVSARISIGIEGMSSRLRQLVRKPITDDSLEKLLLQLLDSFAFVNVYLIIGLPDETQADQHEMERLLTRVLCKRKPVWSGHPGRLLVTSTPFQAMPLTPWERMPAPAPDLVLAWHASMRSMNEEFEYFFAFNIKSPRTADILFALHRAGPEFAIAIEEMGLVRAKSTWGTTGNKRFARLLEKHDLSLNPLLKSWLTDPPRSQYVTL
jgi:radical SAM superfamily enzyme YgiQ (UPF0313 family)